MSEDTDEPIDADGIAQDPSETNRPTAGFRANFLPDSHVEELRRYEEQVPGAGGVEILVELERLRKEKYPDLYRRMFEEAGSSDDIYLILSSLLRREGQTYDELTGNVVSSRRTVKRRVYDLRDLNIVEVGGRPARVHFQNDEVRLLASDVTSFLG
jgi:hypothetical protein